MSDTSCPSREECLAFHLGKLPEEKAEVLIAHFGSCPDCQAMLDTFDAADDTLIAKLRTPAQDLYSDEPQRQELVAKVKAMAGQFVAPHGIAVDSRGDLYVGEVIWTAYGSKLSPPRELRSVRKLVKVDG